MNPQPGNYHSFRQGVHKLADKIIHPEGRSRVERVEVEASYTRPAPCGDVCPPASASVSATVCASGSYVPNTVTIPCNHIRIGDFVMLQGRPCQVIRISTSNATGQYRYLGVDLFTKQLHEESSFVSHPAPSVVVQTMLGPVFKQYRVLDMSDGFVVAMTETGDVKHSIPVIDQSGLWSRIQEAFRCGRGSVRILVLNDCGRELAVDMKVVHGSRL
jgi:translation elongation factor P/translation initiation factor 5A